MQTTPTTVRDSATQAHLFVHASPNVQAAVLKESAFQRLRARYRGISGHHQPEAIQLRVTDLNGREVFVSQCAGPIVDIVLPAGTYHVTAAMGRLQRIYALTMKAGTSFDLYLKLPGVS